MTFKVSFLKEINVLSLLDIFCSIHIWPLFDIFQINQLKKALLSQQGLLLYLDIWSLDCFISVDRLTHYHLPHLRLVTMPDWLGFLVYQ